MRFGTKTQSWQLAAPFITIAQAFADLERGVAPDLFSTSVSPKRRSRSTEHRRLQILATAFFDLLMILDKPREAPQGRDRIATFVAGFVREWPGMGGVEAITIINWRDQVGKRHPSEQQQFEMVRDHILSLPDPRSEVEELLRNPPGVLFSCGTLNQQEIDTLRGAGVPLSTLCRPCIAGAGQVISDGDATFTFEGHCKVDEPSVRAILFPGFDEAGTLIDIVAWAYVTGWIGSWLGRAWGLGAEQVFQPRLDEHGALIIWRSPLNWLRSNWSGLVLIRLDAAIYHLEDAGPVVAEDLEHGSALRQLLMRPPNSILVPNGGEA